MSFADGDQDVVSQGSSGTGGSWRPSGLLVALAVGCVAVGAVVGGWVTASGSGPLADLGRTESGVVAGEIEAVPAPRRQPEFALPVYNPGPRDLKVTLLSLDGLESEVRGDNAVLPAEGWGEITFRAPTDCRTPTPMAIPTATLRLATNKGDDRVVLPLPGDGQVVLDYRRFRCAADEPVTRRDLAGVWLVETVYGQSTGLEGVHLIRFETDGTYQVDSDGELFSGRPAVWGTYELDGSRLTMQVDGGYEGCSLDVSSTWRVAFSTSNRMSLAWERGFCMHEPGGVWVTRRVLQDSGLPR